MIKVEILNSADLSQSTVKILTLASVKAIVLSYFCDKISPMTFKCRLQRELDPNASSSFSFVPLFKLSASP